MDDTGGNLIIVSGMSGAGRSSVADVLEDLGWFVVDNLPPMFLTTIVEQVVGTGAAPRLAVVVDSRSTRMTTGASLIPDSASRVATTLTPFQPSVRGLAPVATHSRKWSSSSASGSVRSVRGTWMSPARSRNWYSPYSPTPTGSAPLSYTRSLASESRSSNTTMRREPTTVVRRSLDGSSQETCRWARTPRS